MEVGRKECASMCQHLPTPCAEESTASAPPFSSGTSSDVFLLEAERGPTASPLNIASLSGESPSCVLCVCTDVAEKPAGLEFPTARFMPANKETPAIAGTSSQKITSTNRYSVLRLSQRRA